MEHIKYSFIGHKDRCFDVKYSSDASTLLSGIYLDYRLSHISIASEDGTAKLWNTQTKQVIQTLTHNNQAEVLRSSYLADGMICTCGSDGNAILWRHCSNANTYSQVLSLPHNDQIYACVTTECISSAHVITAADNLLHIWDLSSSNDSSYSISFDCFSSVHNTGCHTHRLKIIAFPGSQNDAFGGPRNPDNKAFIFDVQPAATTPLSQGHEGCALWTSIALALSDGLAFVRSN